MAIARDVSSPAVVSLAHPGGGGDDPAGTSASFTPPLNSWVTIAIGCDTNTGVSPTLTVSNTGFTVNSGAAWTQSVYRADAEGTGGVVAVYRGLVTTSAAGTVSVTVNNMGTARISQNSGQFYVDVWTGAHATQTTAAVGEGSFTTNTFASTMLATTAANSQVIAMFGDWNATGAAAPTTTQQGTGFQVHNAGANYYTGIRTYQTTPGAAGNVAAAFDASGTGATDTNWGALELLDAGGGGGGATQPPRSMHQYRLRNAA
jgi:hypothetical protein